MTWNKPTESVPEKEDTYICIVKTEKGDIQISLLPFKTHIWEKEEETQTEDKITMVKKEKPHFEMGEKSELMYWTELPEIEFIKNEETEEVSE